jgi:hypothetical protein
MLIMVSLIDQWIQCQPHTKFFSWLSFILIGIALTGSSGITSVPVWLTSGIGLGILLQLFYHSIIRLDRSTVPLAVAGFIVFKCIQGAFFNAYPGAIIDYLATALVISAFAIFWNRLLNKR